MTHPAPNRAARRRPPRRRPIGRLVAALLLAVLLLLVGISVGRALEDGPSPGGTQTNVRTLDPFGMAGWSDVQLEPRRRDHEKHDGGWTV